MAEINRNISLIEIPEACRQLESAGSSTDQEDIGYMTDLAWRKAWRVAKEVIPLGPIANTIFKAATKQPTLVVPKTAVEGRPQPSYVESLLETEARLNFLHNYLPYLPDNVLGVISGGSMSFGRFNNVRAGYPNSSDLDLLFVMDHPPAAGEVDSLIRTDLGFQRSEQQVFRERVPVFEEGFTEGTIDVLSQKFRLPIKRFDISAHFIPKSVMTRFMDQGLKADIHHGRDTDVRLNDYKPHRFRNNVNRQRDFLGNVYPLAVDDFDIANGAISMTPAYAIFSGNLVPGMYHNHCSPMFEVALDRGGISDMVSAFQTVMHDSVESTRRISSDANLSNSHLRQAHFSRHIREEIDRM